MLHICKLSFHRALVQRLYELYTRLPFIYEVIPFFFFEQRWKFAIFFNRYKDS
jgi:hypothetical protein